MDKRYQVFVSSTYKDLEEEREQVIQALLELDCIPAGMELFPAANEDQWTLIKRVIDDSDYYIVIIAGRYGTVGPDGISYTEAEYRYALAQNKPIVAFLHKDPNTLVASRTEQSPEFRQKLQAFRELAEKKMVKYWTTPDDLGSVVSRSLVRLMKDHPGVGWVRGDQLPDGSTVEEILRLRRRIDELEGQKNTSRPSAPQGVEGLANGGDTFQMAYTFDSVDESHERTSFQSAAKVTWDSVFSAISPLMIDEASESALLQALNSFIWDQEYGKLVKRKQFKDCSLRRFEVEEVVFQTIKIQFRALGYIVRSERPRSVKDKDTYWTLTPYGDEVMTHLRAIKRA